MMIYRLTDSLCDRVTAVSTPAAERFLRWRAVSRQKLSVITNAIDHVKFAPDRRRRKRMREQMHAGGEFIWLAVGRLAPAKDYPNMLRAFAKVRAVIPQTQLWIAGEGDPFALSTERTADEPDGVRLLGLCRDVPDLLDAADGFVLSSAWEGMPLALGEAMAMEKPVAATDVGGVRELVGKAGILVPAGDSDALCTAMLSVQREEESTRRFQGRAGRIRIEEHFSMEARVEEWETLYRHALEARAR